MKSIQIKTILVRLKGGAFRKPCFIRTQKSQNINIKNKVPKQKQIKQNLL